MDTSDNHWVCTWDTGPDAGGARRLGPGRHLVGRTHTAAVRCDDPGLEPHHALIEVRGDGTLQLTQLTGFVPLLTVRPDGATSAIEAPLEVHGDALVAIGGSTLAIARADPHSPEPASAHLRAGALVRAPRAVPQYSPVELHAPAPPPTQPERTGGLTPALLGLAGAGAIALVLRQPMFLLFGALGGVVAIASWVAQRIAVIRRHRAAQTDHAEACASHAAAVHAQRAMFEAVHRATVPTLGGARTTIAHRGESLWARRAAHPDAYLVALGVGDVAPPTGNGTGAGNVSPGWRWPGAAHEGESIATLAADERATHHGLAVAASLCPGSRLAVHGRRADGIVRALVIQLAASVGPADLRLVVVTEHAPRWDCLSGLPHLAMPDGTVAIVGEAQLAATLAELTGHGAHLLVVTDHPAQLATRTSPLRRLLADAERHAVIVAVPEDEGVPHLCTSVLSMTAGPIGRWVPDTQATLLPSPVRVAGLGEQSAFACSAALRGIVDPEDPLSIASGVPREVSLVALLATTVHDGLTPAGIVANWADSAADPAPRTLIGVADDGAVDLDLVRDGPHGLIAGTTGAGKSELLRSLVIGMAVQVSPTHLSFVLIDYKGGATFDACAALPHVVGVITDLDDTLADRALRSLHAELRRREAILRDHLVADLPGLRASAPGVVLPRLVVVIDEFAALVAEQPAFLHALVGIAQRGRSLGVHLLLATQRPNGVISDDIRANTNLRLALRLQDSSDAIDVVGVATPALLPRGVPGRAVMRLGADDHLTFQTARCTGPSRVGAEETELTLLARSITEAATMIGFVAPPPPWQPPLPTSLQRHEVQPGAVGSVDDPDRQQIVPLRWAPTDGHLLVAASPGSGATSTLLTLAAQVMTARGPGETPHLYVLDGRGDARLGELAHHPGCGAIVMVHERERVMRLLHRLSARTRARGADGQPVVLMIDGLDAIRRTLDDVETAAEFDALDEVLADGEHAGITIVATVEHAAAVPAAFVARCAHRWVLHVHDPHDASLLGVPAARVPGPVPGRLVVAATGLHAQLLAPGARALYEVRPASRTAPRIEVVPALVNASDLPPGRWHDGAVWMPWGLALATGEAHIAPLLDGEHLLVVGGPRTGRTMALELAADAWRSARGNGWIGVITPRPGRGGQWPGRSTSRGLDVLDSMPAHGPVLVIIDDAELVDDQAGRLAALAAGQRPDTSLYVAGRPDALRAQYGHWTTVVRRSRNGLVLTGGSELDGDLLGAVLPRRTPVPPRAGLAWAVFGGPPQLVQLAVPNAGDGVCPAGQVTAAAMRRNAAATSPAISPSVLP
jgi:DNA segregation ATPase FtsK/SpoIIIE, S-DNA-T family